MQDVIGEVDIFVTTTGNKDIIMATDMSKMKNNAIVGNIGHFDNEIDMAGLMGWPGIKRQNIKPQVSTPPPPLLVTCVQYFKYAFSVLTLETWSYFVMALQLQGIECH